MSREDYFPDLNLPSQIRLFLARRNLFHETLLISGSTVLNNSHSKEACPAPEKEIVYNDENKKNSSKCYKIYYT